MEQSKVNQLIQKSGSNFPSSKLTEIKQKLEQAPDGKYDELMKIGYRSGVAMFFLAFFFIGLGLDRFMTGSKKGGIVRIISFIAYLIIYVGNQESTISETEVILPVLMVLIGIWWLIELFTTFGRAKKYNYKKFSDILAK
jgi:hypothetical protein